MALLENGNPSHILGDMIPPLGQIAAMYIEDKITALTENLPSIYQLIPTQRYYDYNGSYGCFVAQDHILYGIQD